MSAQGVAIATQSTQPERGHAMGKTKVRTTFTPATVNEVEKAELIDLSRGGLLFSHETTDDTRELGLKSPERWRDGKVETVESGVITDVVVDDDESEGKE